MLGFNNKMSPSMIRHNYRMSPSLKRYLQCSDEYGNAD